MDIINRQHRSNWTVTLSKNWNKAKFKIRLAKFKSLVNFCFQFHFFLHSYVVKE